MPIGFALPLTPIGFALPLIGFALPLPVMPIVFGISRARAATASYVWLVNARASFRTTESGLRTS